MISHPISPFLFPGEGRAPVAGRCMASAALRDIGSGNRTPAFTGEQLPVRVLVRARVATVTFATFAGRIRR
jgi:hypothetical protein